MTTVRLFAGLAEAAGSGSVDIAWEGGTAAELLSRLARERPALAGRVAACRVAVDHEFVGPTDPVDPAAEIALIPPVSGG